MKRLIGSLVIISSLVIGFSSGASAELPPIPSATTVTSSTGGPTQLQSNIGGAKIGYIKVGSAEIFSLGWKPDFKFGPWGLGADINLSLGDNKPTNYDNYILRYIEYDDQRKGLRYGVLDGITLGHGLVMNNYTTRLSDQVILTNQQMGFKGYADLDKYVLRGMLTRSNIYYVRAEERLNPTLTLGEYYVADSTGRAIKQTNGTTKQFPSVSAIGLDASLALPANFTGFAEAGQILNHGSGLTAGLSWGYNAMVANVSFLAEYRSLDKSFVPGYFGVDYETNPIDLVSAEATNQPKNGTLMQLEIDALGLASLKAAYESYQGSNSVLNADLMVIASEQLRVRGYYKQPNFADFRSITLEQGAILGADVAYKINQNTSLITHYKKAYNPTTGRVELTQYYEIALSL